MIDKDKESQWDREMAEVDRMLAKLPTYEPAKHGPGGQPTVRRSGPALAGAPGGTVGGMWLKVILGLLVAIGVTIWPYTHVCGAKLLMYLIATGTVAISGGWAALATWKRRHGLAHLLALAVLGWGLALTALTVQPRIAGGALWFCPEPPTQSAPTPR